MDIRVFAVPYDSARREWRLGRGPGRLLRAGLLDTLHARGHRAEVEWVEPSSPDGGEIATMFDLARSLAERVRGAAPAFPLVLSGNCSAALGVLAGTRATGIVWLDAHGDLNTPETTRSGYLDGTTLSTAIGRCWREMAADVPGLRPIPDERVVLVGARDLDPGEEELLGASAITRVGVEEVRAGTLVSALDRLSGAAYLHLDLDVLDPAEGRANSLAVPGGLTVEEVEVVVRTVAARLPIAGATLSAYDPAYDPEGRIPAAAARIAGTLLEAMEGSGPAVPGR
ncbi:MAG TPA: arginase family protein [Longimicrobiaceae bacterium]|nr:arginase family protein [Longimicrobiaceae bacterium]